MQKPVTRKENVVVKVNPIGVQVGAPEDSAGKDQVKRRRGKGLLWPVYPDTRWRNT